MPVIKKKKNKNKTRQQHNRKRKNPQVIRSNMDQEHGQQLQWTLLIIFDTWVRFPTEEKDIFFKSCNIYLTSMYRE